MNKTQNQVQNELNQGVVGVATKTARERLMEEQRLYEADQQKKNDKIV